MATRTEHTVGMRELRHKTSEVLARVRRGETVDVTEYGRLIARIVPVQEPTPPPALKRLIDAGRVAPAARPGFRPRMHDGDGTDRLGDTLATLRDQERW